MNKIFDKLTLIVGEKNILIEQKELIKYSEDWRGFYNNKSLCVVFPINTKTLKEIVIFCFENDIKIVPQGGNTSLTGASVPTYKSQEIIINFSKIFIFFKSISLVFSMIKKYFFLQINI